MAASAAPFTLGEIEEFLIDEAALLDEWRLDEWLELLAPTTRTIWCRRSMRRTPIIETTLFLIADDRRTSPRASGNCSAAPPGPKTRVHAHAG